MSQAIYKFVLRPGSMVIDTYEYAMILSAGVQGDNVVIWALCDADAKMPCRRLVVAWPTGVVLPPALEDARFVDTVQMADGLVFHVFEGAEER